jgi:acyl-CoA synthetase (NDP forming)
MAVVGNDPNVDSLVAMYAPPIEGQASVAAEAIAQAATQIPVDKPLLAVFQFAGKLSAGLDSARGPIPTYAFPENPAIALGAAWRYSRWRHRPRGTTHTLGRFGRDTVRAVVERALAHSGDVCTLSREEIATVLRAAAIAVAQAEDQAAVPDLPAGLDEPPPGIPIFAGVTTDPTFGPLIAFGFGSPPGDVVFRLHPLTDVDATEMIAAVRTSRAFEGHSNLPLREQEALAALLTRVSALVETIPEMVELELHPVSVQAPGKGAIVLNARMQLERMQ